MTELSVKYAGGPWASEIEFWLYLQLSGWKFRNVFSLAAEEVGSLRKLSQSIGGWLKWDLDKKEAVFMPSFEWSELYCEWHFKKQFETIGYLEK